MIDDKDLIEKVLDLQQRRRRSANLRRMKHKLQKAKELYKKRFAPERILQKRSRVLAKALVRRRFAGQKGAEYINLAPSDKITVDKIVDKKVLLVKKLAQRIYPIIKRKEQQRVQSIYSKNAFPVNTINNPIPLNQSLDSKTETALRKKALLSEIPFELLEQVYKRGLQSWSETSHLNPEQIAFNRVNSFISGGKAYELDEDLRKWFKEKWVRMDTKGNIKGECARGKGEGKPKCLPLAKARAMSKEKRAKAARKKRHHDPVADRPGKGEKPVFVATEEVLLEKNVPTKPALWARAKSLAKQKFDVYPSAYANGWASKWYKKRGGGWKSLNESKHKHKKRSPAPPAQKLESPINLRPQLSDETKNREVYSIYRKSMDPMTEGKFINFLKNLNKKTKFPLDRYDSTAKKIFDTKKKWGPPRGKASRKAYDILASKGYYPYPPVPNPSGEQVNEDVLSEKSPAWQRKEGKDPKGGLNRKGVASYRRENPGSKLQMAVTTKPSKLKKGSKAWKRRKSFCARMSGAPGPMKDEKGRPTRKALALRKWNC